MAGAGIFRPTAWKLRFVRGSSRKQKSLEACNFYVIIEFKYPGAAQLVARVVWEREAEVRAAVFGKPGTPWDTWAVSTFPLAGNWSKTGVDHMFDHS